MALLFVLRWPCAADGTLEHKKELWNCSHHAAIATFTCPGQSMDVTTPSRGGSSCSSPNFSSSLLLLLLLLYILVPAGSPSRGGDVTVYVFFFWRKATELAHSFLFSSSVYFCLYGPFNCISLYKFSPQLSAFSLCSSGLISALLIVSTIYLIMKVSVSLDIILCGWLGLKHQLPN